MKVSEYVLLLNRLMVEHGDLEVKYLTYPQCSTNPAIGFMLKPKVMKNGEIDKRTLGTINFWLESDGEERKGEKVIKL